MGCASRHREPEGRVRGIHLGWMGVGERGVGCGEAGVIGTGEYKYLRWTTHGHAVRDPPTGGVT